MNKTKYKTYRHVLFVKQGMCIYRQLMESFTKLAISRVKSNSLFIYIKFLVCLYFKAFHILPQEATYFF